MTTSGPNAPAPDTRARCASWTLCLPLRARGCSLEALARQRRCRGRRLHRHGARLPRCGRGDARRRHIPERAAVDVRSILCATAACRALFTVAGGYVTARLAPDRPMRHAWVLAGIGLVAGLAGVVAYYAIGGAELGPSWYAISIPVEAIPCVWLGGWLAASRRS